MSGTEEIPDEARSPSKAPVGLLNRLEISFIRIYQWLLSPIIGQQCRFYPTCSVYGIHALERYGFLTANGKIIARIIRCNPWSSGGYDPA